MTATLSMIAPQEIRGRNEFSSPLTLMMSCHRRIERFLGQLLKVINERQGGSLTPDERESFDLALRYFRNGVPLHGIDEEDSLFPRLRASTDPIAMRAVRTVDELEAEHRLVEETHSAIELLGRRWLAAGRLSPTDADVLIRLANGLREIYRHHIEVEDSEVFVAARKALGADEIEAIGREMAERRGIEYDGWPTLSRLSNR